MSPHDRRRRLAMLPAAMAVAIAVGAAGATATSGTAAPFEQSARTIDDLVGLGRPVVLAHGAGGNEFPTETLFAFGESAAAGVDMLDLDVQLTGDGVLVVHHDDDVDRLTNGTGLVRDHTAAELGAVDYAYWFTTDCTCTDRPAGEYVYRGVRSGEQSPPDGYVADDFGIPTLAALLARFPDLPLNIEIKGEGEVALAAADRLAVELADRDPATVLVSSFDDAVLARFQQAAPDIEVSPALGAATAFVLEGTPLPDGQRILQLPPRYGDFEVLTADVIGRAEEMGYEIWVWPNDRALENVAAYTEFLDAGIDGLNIDVPTAGIAAVEAWLAAT